MLAVSPYREVLLSGFTPRQLPGLMLWLSADRGVFQNSALSTPAVSDGDPVGGWADQSGKGNNATQAVAGQRPTLKLNIVSGLPIVRFDGVDDVLSTSLAAVSPSATVAHVSKGDGGLFSRLSDNTYGHGLRAASGTYELSDYDGVSANFELALTLSFSSTTTFATYQVDVSNNGANTGIATIRTPAMATVATTTAKASNRVTDLRNIGRSLDGTGPSYATQFTGDIAEIVVVSHVLNSAERAGLWQYFAQKYAVRKN